MPSVTIEVPHQILSDIREKAAVAGMTVAEYIADMLQSDVTGDWPKATARVLGTWEDDRTPEQILDDIREGPAQRERPELE